MSSVTVVPYDPRWPRIFERERDRLAEALGPAVVEIEHFGSTAVPGLAAKPVIDVMVWIDALTRGQALVDPVVALGYEYVPAFEDELPFRRYFRRHPDDELAPGVEHAGYHVHMLEHRHPWGGKDIAFRDHLRTNPKDARAYGTLKLELARRFPSDRNAYIEAKSPFIRALLERIERQ